MTDSWMPLSAGLTKTEEQVAKLTHVQRIDRVRDLVRYSHSLVDAVIADQESRAFRKPKGADDILFGGNKRRVVGVVALYSGGNDSTTLTHLFSQHPAARGARFQATHAGHANTTIGIEKTRQFVRDTCALWSLPLMEKLPPTSYRELVLEQGFPGPGHHFKMYQRLKERGMRQMRAEIIGSNGRSQRVVFLMGRRRTESARRAGIQEIDELGAQINVSPLVYWTKLDLMTYRRMFDVPTNEVSDLLHMSGECLCGAFAHPGELDEIDEWYPEVAAEIRALEKEVAATGKFPARKCVWGHGNGKPTEKVGAMCSSCEFRADPEHVHNETVIR